MKFLALIAIVFSLSLTTGCNLSFNGEDLIKNGEFQNGNTDLGKAIEIIKILS